MPLKKRKDTRIDLPNLDASSNVQSDSSDIGPRVKKPRKTVQTTALTPQTNVSNYSKCLYCKKPFVSQKDMQTHDAVCEEQSLSEEKPILEVSTDDEKDIDQFFPDIDYDDNDKLYVPSKFEEQDSSADEEETSEDEEDPKKTRNVNCYSSLF